jgi:hypothetical protein
LTKREKLNYVAGLVDGEGCITIQHPRKKRSFCLKVVIGNTDLSLLESVKKDMRIGRIHLHKSNKVSNIKHNFKLYNYIVTGPQALLMLRQLLPFLRSRKKEAVLGIKFQENKAKFKSLNRPNWLDHRRLPQKAIFERKGMYLRMKKLKSEGRELIDKRT